MKPSFHVRQLNGPFDDPGLYIRLIREGRAFIFDLGFTTNLSTRDILKTCDIFISHTHVDHFIGFDNILRISLKKESPLRLYGPEGFIECVESRLKSYTWNVVQEYPMVIEVHEITEQNVRKAVFKAENSFARQDLAVNPFTGMIMKESFYFISGVVLDHQIPCLAFSLEEENHINIDKARLNGLNLPVGPWLQDLKNAIRANDNERVFHINKKTFSFGELQGIASVTKGQKISYVVDAVGSNENIDKIITLVKDSDVLYIEAYFSDADRDRARQRYHLTAAEAGRIGRRAGVGRLEITHFSPRYIDDPGRLINEAQQEFNKG